MAGNHSAILVEKMRNCSLAKVFILIIGLATPSCATAETATEAIANTGNWFVDWENLRPADSPNNWLLVPRNGDLQHADEIAPVFAVAPHALANAWKAVIEDQPRTAIVAVSDDGLQIEAWQESSMFRFIDQISSRISSLSENKSTIAIYSRSTVGYWDLGVNKRRVRDWLEVLGNRIAAVGRLSLFDVSAFGTNLGNSCRALIVFLWL
jgi:uncharacterized protein (DUF1499 family)